MSFDLFLVRPPDDGDWDAAMDRHGERSGPSEGFDEDDERRWAEIRRSVSAILPEVEESGSDTVHELTAPSFGLQVFMYPGETGLSVPYWYEHEEAERIVGVLRDLATELERITGLTAYDPQSGGPFLSGGIAQAAPTFDRVAGAMAVGGDGPGRPPAPEPVPRPWWKFWG